MKSDECDAIRVLLNSKDIESRLLGMNLYLSEIELELCNIQNDTIIVHTNILQHISALAKSKSHTPLQALSEYIWNRIDFYTFEFDSKNSAYPIYRLI